MRHLALTAAVVLVAGCSNFAPDAGHEIVLIKKPWIFGHGGIESEPVRTGRVRLRITQASA